MQDTQKRQFYRSFFAIVMPIAIQQLITAVEQVRVSTVLNSVALVLNIGLNAAFIFGWIPGIPPLGFIAAFVWNLPPLWVYLILSCDEFAKMPFVYIRYRQKKWLRNITKEVTA